MACREVLIEKHYRGVVNRSVCDLFWAEVSSVHAACRGNPAQACGCAQFFPAVQAASPQEVLPVITTPKYYLFHVLRHRLFFLANVTAEARGARTAVLGLWPSALPNHFVRRVFQAPPLLVVEYLNRVVDTFQEYFGEVSEEIIKENFVTIYQVLLPLCSLFPL
jgi:AP-3 complex subunit mu